MKAYKGFDKNMKCRDFQYEEGKAYETKKAKVCDFGFHACENPLDCLKYYSLNDSVYHEVEMGGRIDKSCDGDSKIAATKITIGAKLSIAGIVKGAIDFVMRKVKAAAGYAAHAATAGRFAHAATVGDSAHAATAGRFAHAATAGYAAHAATAGDAAHAATAGDSAHAVTAGDAAHAATAGRFANAVTAGDAAHAATAGDSAHAVTAGRFANAATAGDSAHAAVRDCDAMAVVCGHDCKAKGGVGSWLVLTERDNERHILGVRAIKIDGHKYKPDTWYTLRGGKVVEVKDGGAE